MIDSSPELNQIQPKNEKISKRAIGKISPAIKKAAGRVILSTPLTALVTLSGNVDNPKNLNTLNIKDPTPVVSPLPLNTSHNTESLQFKISHKSEQRQEKEGTRTFSPSLTILDILPPDRFEGQAKFLSLEEVVRRLVHLDPKHLNNSFNNPEAYVLAGMLSSEYYRHGEYVLDAMNKIWTNDNLMPDKITAIPVQNALGPEDITTFIDELGNKGLSVHFSAEKIIKLLKNDPSKVVNVSLQVGRDDFTAARYIKKGRQTLPLLQERDAATGLPINNSPYYAIPEGQGYNSVIIGNTIVPADSQSNPLKPLTPDQLQDVVSEYEQRNNENAEVIRMEKLSLEVKGAYEKGKAFEYLQEQFKVCDAFPKKLFVFAAGNYGEDLTEALGLLSAKKPKNLLIVGEWGNYNRPKDKVKGADIYVNNYEMNLGRGSSFSTAVVSAYAAELFDKGLSQEEVIKEILGNTYPTSYKMDGRKYSAKILIPPAINK